MSLISSIRRIISLLRFKKHLSDRDDPVSNKLEDVVDDGIESALDGALDGLLGSDDDSGDAEWGN